jgi:hypothetical protein
MLDIPSAEVATLLVSILGGVCTLLSVAWVKVIKPLIKLLNNQDEFKDSIELIRKELMTNGGNSLKDTVIDLRKVCHRIETRQRIGEQRTKASMHYSTAALFETDTEGRLLWNNSNFCRLFKEHSNGYIEGYDWLSFINENDREDLLSEFRSCLKMNRKFSRETTTYDGMKITMIGYPYKITESEHGGFLVSVSLTSEV